VFNPITWPMTLMGMAGSYGGGLLGKRLSEGLVRKTQHPAQLTVSQRAFFALPGNQIMLTLLNADYSGLVLDERNYKALQYKSKYSHLLQQLNKLGAHFLGLYKVAAGAPSLWKEQGLAVTGKGLTHEAQAALRSVHQRMKNVTAKRLRWDEQLNQRAYATKALMQLPFRDNHLPLLTRGLNAMMALPPVRWLTATPIMGILPNRDAGTQAGSWLHEIPIIGAALGEKVPKLGRVRALYFNTEPTGDIEKMRMKHWKRFTHYINQCNIALRNHGSSERLHYDEPQFKEYLKALSKHEKQTAVRLGLYYLLFNLREEAESMGGFLKRWQIWTAQPCVRCLILRNA
jgi:hypothetical protein